MGYALTIGAAMARIRVNIEECMMSVQTEVVYLHSCLYVVFVCVVCVCIVCVCIVCK